MENIALIGIFITVIADHDKPQPSGCLLGNMPGVMAIFICIKKSRKAGRIAVHVAA